MTAHLVLVMKRQGKPGSSVVHRVLVLTPHPGPRLQIPHDAGVVTFEGGPRSFLRLDLGEQRDHHRRPHDLTGVLPRLALAPLPRCSGCCQDRGLTAHTRAVRRCSKAACLLCPHRAHSSRSRTPMVLWVKHLNDELTQ